MSKKRVDEVTTVVDADGALGTILGAVANGIPVEADADVATGNGDADLPVINAFRQSVLESSPDIVWSLNPEEIIVDPSRNGRADAPKPSDKDIREMAESIKAVGQLSPGEVVIDRTNRMYLVFGYRRFCAINLINATRSGADALPFKAFVRIDVDTMESRTRNLVENDRRKDLTVLDRAKVVSDYIKDGLNQKQIADRTGWSRATVSNYTKVNAFPDSVKELISSGKLPTRAAIELCVVDAAKLEESAAKLVELAGPTGSITVTSKGDVQVNPTSKRKKKAAGGKSDALTIAELIDVIDWLLEAKQRAQLHKSIEEVLRIMGDVAFGRTKRAAALTRLALYK